MLLILSFCKGNSGNASILIKQVVLTADVEYCYRYVMLHNRHSSMYVHNQGIRYSEYHSSALGVIRSL